MKRVLTILAILLLPLSVWAMTPVSDSDLSNVTGQAGVNINADLMMDISIGTMAWGDASGLDWGLGWDTNAYDALGTGNDAAGYVGVTGFNLNSLHIRARIEAGDTYGGYSRTSFSLTGNHLKPITIDVATSTVAGMDGKLTAGVTFVRFGLGSLQISMQDMDLLVSLGTAGSNLNQNLGEVYIGGLNLYINSRSYVDIYKNPVTNSGVTFDVNVTLDKVGLTSVAWGDTDGITNLGNAGESWNWMTAAHAGYVGLQNIQIGAITVVGSVSIDINSDRSGQYITQDKWVFDNYIADELVTASGLYRPLSVTVVHITFGENGNPFVFTIGGPLTADVNLSPYKNVTSNTSLGQPLGNTKTLGDIYLSGFSLNIQSSSWLDIWAH
jgi:hypothetical protein